MATFVFETDCPKFSLDQAVRYRHEGVDVTLRIVRVVTSGRWSSVDDFGPLEGEEGEGQARRPGRVSQAIEFAYAAQVIRLKDSGGRSLKLGQVVTFQRGQRGLASVEEFETHGKFVHGMPSDRKVKGDAARMVLLDRATEDARAEYLAAQRSGVIFPVVQVVEVDGYSKVGPRGVVLDGFDVDHFPLQPQHRSSFENRIPDGHFPVVVLTTDNGSTHASLPIEV